MFALALCFIAALSAADHPTEGDLTLDQLLMEAERNSLELKQAEQSLKAREMDSSSALGRFAPEISIEGGPLASQIDGEEDTGTAFYGKAEWNLFRGGADKAAFDQSKIRRNLERRKLAAVRSKVRRDVSRLYYELLFVLESIALKERGLSMNLDQLKLARIKRSSGFTSSADVIEFELREATLRSDLAFLNQERERAGRTLSVALGRARSSAITVKGHLARENLPVSEAKILPLIRERNPEVLEARAALELGEKDKRIAASNLLPSVDLEARYGKLEIDERVTEENDNHLVMLKFSVPLFSGLGDVNAYRSARAESTARSTALAKRNLDLMAEAETVLAEINAISNRLDIEEKNLARSEEYYKISLGEYRRGVKNSPDMVGATERLLDARMRNLEFRRDYQLAILKLYELAGLDRSALEPARISTAPEKIGKSLAAGKIHEECMMLKPGQKLEYSFAASAELNFNIHYHKGEDVAYPVRKKSASENATFAATREEDYCLMWTNESKSPVNLEYSVQIQ